MRVGITFDQRHLNPHMERVADLILTHVQPNPSALPDREWVVQAVWDAFSRYVDFTHSQFVGGANVDGLLDEFLWGESLNPLTRHEVVAETANQFRKALFCINDAMYHTVHQMWDREEELYEVTIQPAPAHIPRPVGMLIVESMPCD